MTTYLWFELFYRSRETCKSVMHESKDQIHPNLSKDKYQCTHENCSSIFDRPYRLKQHLLVHENIKAFPCTVEKCSKAYTSKSHLDRHIKTAHTVASDVYIFSCPKCLKTFSNLQNVKKHINVVHNKDKILSCDICHLDFKKKHQLTTHMYQHTGVKAFSCELCDKSFVTLLEKKKHVRSHKTYSCERCSEVFVFWSAYQKHKKSQHAVEEYICHHCSRKFNQRVHILRHMKYIHSNTSEINKLYICPYDKCNKKYTSKFNLTHHINVKHKKIKYDCKICSSKLSTKRQLANHMKLKHETTEVKVTVPKTKAISRKERKDKGKFKTSTAIKIAGLSLAAGKPEDAKSFCSTLNNTPQQKQTVAMETA